MAVTPLYATKAKVLENLRMTASEDTDTLAMIDQAIVDVRMEFYRRLTLARATEVAALASIENPTTIDGVLRKVAETTEIYWVMYKLIKILPIMFIETQFAIQNSFDDVPITRDAESLQRFLSCLWGSIEEGLAQLLIPVETSAGAFQSFSTGRPEPFLLPKNFIGL